MLDFVWFASSHNSNNIKTVWRINLVPCYIDFGCRDKTLYLLGSNSIVGITIAQALVCQVVDNLVKAGIEPPVFKSSNVDGGDAHNNRMFDTYYGYWK